ncbi:MAG: hypothetical protein K6F33_12290 [Bacteroidales bacterium]|nr:hypothetical protein [Bacteroidales bacterium]
MDTTISLNNILQMLGALSLPKRIWLAEHLVKPEEKQAMTQREKDEALLRDFFSTPYDNPMTADEAKKMIRESHYFENRT